MVPYMDDIWIAEIIDNFPEIPANRGRISGIPSKMQNYPPTKIHAGGYKKSLLILVIAPEHFLPRFGHFFTTKLVIEHLNQSR